MNYDVMVVEENGKAKAKGRAKRKMHANHRPTYDAKNRYDLPDDMDLDFEPLRKIYEGSVPPRPQKDVLLPDTPTDRIVEDPGEDIREVLIRKLGAEGVSQEDLEAWMKKTGRLAEDGTVMDVSGTAAQAMIDNMDTLISFVKGDNK